MVKRSEIVKEALTWQGTPWHHHQGVKGLGTDCVQFLLGVGRNVGALSDDIKIENYEPLARGSFLLRHLNRWLVEVNLNELKPGSILLISVTGLLTHVGIVCDGKTFIHASARDKAVVVSRLEDYRDSIKKVYDVPGVLDG